MTSEGSREDAVGRSALRKASWRLLPLIGLGYGIAYMDRVNISFASLQMNQDLHFSGAIYGLGGGLFFLSYALFEVPSNLLLVRFGARRWIARIMITWGAVAIGMMFVKTPMQFYIMRFLLGLSEAGFFPGVIYYLTHWFPASHRGRAVSRFYVAWPLSTVVMGGVAGALLKLQGVLGLAGWQWLFLVEGLPAILLSGFIFMLLPDSPAKATWLSAGEKAWIENRLAADVGALGIGHDRNIFRALLNPLVLQLSIVNFLFLGTTYAFALSAPAILAQVTHMSVTNVGYLVAGTGLIAAAAMAINCWHSDYRRERYFHLSIPLLLVACAYAVFSVTTSPLAAMTSYAVSVAATAAVAAAFWLVPGDVLHPKSSAVSVAAINAIGQVGSFISPYAFGLAKDYTGSFHAGLMVLPLPFLVATAMVLLLRHNARTPRITAEAAVSY